MSVVIAHHPELQQEDLMAPDSTKRASYLKRQQLVLSVWRALVRG